MDTSRLRIDRRRGYLPKYDLPENYIFEFGKYKGNLIVNVAQWDPNYILELIDGESMCDGCKHCVYKCPVNEPDSDIEYEGNDIEKQQIKLLKMQIKSNHEIRNLISSNYVRFLQMVYQQYKE